MINIEKVVKIYNKGKENELKVLKGIDLKIHEGELLAIVGKSGAGKTTLLHIIGCIEKFDSGSCKIGKTDISKMNDNQLSDMRNQKIGIVKQDFALIQEYSVIENVMLPLYISEVRNSVRRKKALEALENVGIAEQANKQVRKLSGGQKQRAAIARAIVNNPEVILADEPTGALDTETGGQIMDVFKKLNESGRTIILVTHDMRLAQECHRIVTIEDGEIVAE